MYLVQPYMLTCRWLERCFHTVPSVLVLLHPGVPDELESSKLSFEGWKGLFLLIVTDTNRIPSAFSCCPSQSCPYPFLQIGLIDWISKVEESDVLFITSSGPDLSSVKIGWLIFHTFDRSDRKTEVKRRKFVVTHPLTWSVGRSDRTSSSNPYL